MKYIGKINKIFFNNGTWSSCLVAIKQDKNSAVEMVVTGIPNPIIGVTYKIEGEIVNDAKYGNQIKAISSAPELSDSQYFVSFLSSYVKGVGEVTAKDMYERFGNNLLDIIRDDPERLMCVKRITKKKLELIVENFKENYEALKICQKLHEFTEGAITPNQARKIYNQYKEKTMDVVTKNPYVLIDIDGFGFLTVDKLAVSMGIGKDSIFRAKAALIHSLKNAANTDGHMYLSMNELENLCMDILTSINKEKEKMLKDYIALFKNRKDTSEFLAKLSASDAKTCEMYGEFYLKKLDVLSDAVIELYKEGKIILSDDKKVYEKSLYEAETTCADIINKMSKKRPATLKVNLNRVKKKLDKLEKQGGFKFDEEQTSAVFNTLKSRFSVITGGAGAGKSTIVDLVITGWRGEVVLMAPTGRAAQRLSEVTGLNASTIHKAIYNQDRSINYFKKDSLVVVDEASMINMLLARDLLLAANDCHVVLVGDPNQLPPIGAGNFLTQVLKSKKISISRLSKTYRNMGSINMDANMVNNGKSIKDFVFDDKTQFCELSSKDESKEAVMKLWKKARSEYNLEDIRILAPTRKRGQGSVSSLNEMIREYENPKTGRNTISGSVFRIGDRIMQTKNNYQIDELTKEGKLVKTSVFNGETGTITGYNDDEEAVEITLDTGEVLLYYNDDLNQIELSYAMTVHKSQGSEYKCVITLCTSEHYIMLKRNLIYTAVSRAKEKLYICGMKSSYNQAIRDTQYKEIHCSLAERIA